MYNIFLPSFYSFFCLHYTLICILKEINNDKKNRDFWEKEQGLEISYMVGSDSFNISHNFRKKEMNKSYKYSFFLDKTECFLNAFLKEMILLYSMFGHIVIFRIIRAICLWCIICVLYQLIFQHFAVQTPVAIYTQPCWLLVENMSEEITTITAKNATTASTNG